MKHWLFILLATFTGAAEARAQGPSCPSALLGPEVEAAIEDLARLHASLGKLSSDADRTLTLTELKRKIEQTSLHAGMDITELLEAAVSNARAQRDMEQTAENKSRAEQNEAVGILTRIKRHDSIPPVLMREDNAIMPVTETRVIVSTENQAFLLDLSGTQVPIPVGRPSPAVAVTKDRKTAYLVNVDGIHKLDIASGKVTKLYSMTVTGVLRDVVLDPKEEKLFALSRNALIEFNLRNKSIGTRKGSEHSNYPRFHLDKTGRYALIAGKGLRDRPDLLDLETGRFTPFHKLFDESMVNYSIGAAYDPSIDRFLIVRMGATGGLTAPDGSVLELDPATHAVTISRFPSIIGHITVSPNGRYLLSELPVSSAQSWMKESVFDLATRQPVDPKSLPPDFLNQAWRWLNGGKYLWYRLGWPENDFALTDTSTLVERKIVPKDNQKFDVQAVMNDGKSLLGVDDNNNLFEIY